MVLSQIVSKYLLPSLNFQYRHYLVFNLYLDFYSPQMCFLSLELQNGMNRFSSSLKYPTFVYSVTNSMISHSTNHQLIQIILRKITNRVNSSFDLHNRCFHGMNILSLEKRLI